MIRQNYILLFFFERITEMGKHMQNTNHVPESIPRPSNRIPMTQPARLNARVKTIFYLLKNFSNIKGISQHF